MREFGPDDEHEAGSDDSMTSVGQLHENSPCETLVQKHALSCRWKKTNQAKKWSWGSNPGPGDCKRGSFQSSYWPIHKLYASVKLNIKTTWIPQPTQNSVFSEELSVFNSFSLSLFFLMLTLFLSYCFIILTIYFMLINYGTRK